jgi:bifunctional DNA-binding transcriptional regulator/antitoxin component of YhaV-PrlF toxin-antitoxin module
MSRVTSKLQVTLPKAIADRYGVAPGSDVVFEPAGESIRVLVAREPGLVPSSAMSIADKQALLDAASLRQAVRNRRYRLSRTAAGRKAKPRGAVKPVERGWTREELYDRGRAR